MLHVSEATEWSGGSAQLLALACGLNAKGLTSAVACRPGSALGSQARARGLAVHHLPLRQDYDLRSAWLLSRLILKENFDVIHAHHSRSHGVCLMAKLILALGSASLAPVLVVSRRVSFPIGRNPFSWLKYRSGLIDSYAAVAEAVKEVLVSGGVSAARVRVIHSGVDTSRFAPRTPDPSVLKSLGVPSGVSLIGKIANASPWKGQETFLEAAALLIKESRPVHFLLAGRDTDGPWVKAIMNRLGLARHVALAGFRSDIPDILACLTVSVNAATSGEGLSGALRESLCMGVPVAASDVAGNRELLGEGARDCLFKPGDAEGLAGRLREMLDDPGKARSQAALWRSRLESEFSLTQTVEKTAALYRELYWGSGLHSSLSNSAW